MTSALLAANLIAETSLIFGAALLLMRLPERLRVIMFRCVFAIALVAPIAILAAPARGLIDIPVHATSVSSVSFTEVASSDTSAPPALPPGISVASAPRAFPWTALLLVVWATGTSFVVGRYLLSFVLLSRSFSNASVPDAEMEDEIRGVLRRMEFRGAPVRISLAIGAPCTFGWLQPKVLLPTQFSTAEFVDTLLVHEFSHVKNRDALWLMLGQMACALYWFNPLAWFCAGTHRDLLEIVCDDDAAGFLDQTHDYVTGLLQAARRMLPAPHSAGAMMSNRGLSARIHRLLERTHPMKKPSTFARTLTVASAASIVALVATANVVSAHNDDAPVVPDRADLMRATMFSHAQQRGDVVLYVQAGDNVSVGSRSKGFSCTDGSCYFTFNGLSRLRISAVGTARLAWQGCTPSSDTLTCDVEFKNGEAHVRVERAS